MPDRKEPTYFGSDLVFEKDGYRVNDIGLYLSLFKDATEDHRAIGEASVRYLNSVRAAQEIYSFNPEARIVIMLRNPVDAAYAEHSEFLYNRNENVSDFGAAIDLQDVRLRGGSIPDAAHFTSGLQYTKTFMYSRQVGRYYNVFGMENVLLVLFDRFKKDVKGEYKRVASFLGIDPDFEPEFDIHNGNKRLRSVWVQDMIGSVPAHIRLRISRVVPRRAWHIVFSWIVRANTVQYSREPLDPQLRARLKDIFRSDIKELEQVIGETLDFWYT